MTHQEVEQTLTVPAILVLQHLHQIRHRHLQIGCGQNAKTELQGVHRKLRRRKNADRRIISWWWTCMEHDGREKWAIATRTRLLYKMNREKAMTQRDSRVNTPPRHCDRIVSRPDLRHEVKVPRPSPIPLTGECRVSILLPSLASLQRNYYTIPKPNSVHSSSRLIGRRRRRLYLPPRLPLPALYLLRHFSPPADAAQPPLQSPQRPTSRWYYSASTPSSHHWPISPASSPYYSGGTGLSRLATPASAPFTLSALRQTLCVITGIDRVMVNRLLVRHSLLPSQPMTNEFGSRKPHSNLRA